MTQSDTDQILQWVTIVVLACFSALFSGLTLGLLSLDKIGLKIVMASENETMANYAKIIAPVRENGNLLLCTLLLGNVAVNAYLSILMAEISSGLVGFLTSTAVIVIFGEIIPQASCSRYALQIGSRAIPLVKVLIILMYPICWPLSKVLDWVLGDELGTIHSHTELTELLRMHVQHGAIDVEQGQISEGAITYNDKKVRDVMSSFDDAYVISAADQLNFKKITEIFKSGFSRIPVYDKDKHDIIGILLVKDLIFVDPDDETPVRNFIQIFGRNFHLLWPDDTLGDTLRIFKAGKSHMAIVRDVNNDGPGDPFYEMKGIVTLEDIIEEILQDEIHDETDQNPINDGGDLFDYSKLRLLDSGKLEYEKLTDAEALAIGAHWAKNVAAFGPMNYTSPVKIPNHLTSDIVAKRSESSDIILVDGQASMSSAQSPATGTIELGALSVKTAQVRRNSKQQVTSAGIKEEAPLPDFMELLLDSCPVIDQARVANVGESPLPQDFFYKRGKEADFMIMVLTGKITVEAGRDGFKSEAGPWSVLGADALRINGEYDASEYAASTSTKSNKSEISVLGEFDSYVPDFSASINSPELRYIKISRRDFKKALRGEYVWKASVPTKGMIFKPDAPVQPRQRSESSSSAFDAGATKFLANSQVAPPASLEPDSTAAAVTAPTAVLDVEVRDSEDNTTPLLGESAKGEKKE